MLSRIQKLFAPPVFEDDEDKTRIAGVLNTLLVIMMLFLLFNGVIIVPFVFVEKLGNFALGLGYFLAVAVAYWQTQRGRVRLASVILVYGLWIVFTIFLLFAGGMTSIAAVFYVSGTVIAGLLLGTRAALVYAVACILAGLGMVILESSDRSLPRIFPVPVLIGWVDLILSLLLTTTVLNLVLRGLNDALTLARRQVEERRQAEKALRKSEEWFRAIYDRQQSGMIVIEPETHTIISANTAALEMIGVPGEEAIGEECHTFICPAERGKCPVTDLGQCIDHSERVLVTRAGTLVPVLKTVSRITIDGEDYLVEGLVDITDRKRTDEALRESEERYRVLVENSTMGVGISQGNQVIFANPALLRIFGYDSLEEFARIPLLDHVAPSSREMISEREEKTTRGEPVPVEFEYDIVRQDGQIRTLQAATSMVTLGDGNYRQTTFRDITERKRAEEALQESHHRLEETLAELKETQEQMLHQERLAAVGQLAAGIAHDFNNILATIVLYTQMSLRMAELPPQIRQRLEIIGEQTDRAADLVLQILDFGRRAVLERRPLALDSFLKEVVKLLERTLPESIQIDLAFEPVLSSEGPGEYLINADLTRIQQAIVNLALNARDAMPNGGELHVALSRAVNREIQCVDCGPVIGGEWVQVTVTDTGAGIAPEALPRIFEPFFTTRAPLGHGLGLSQVYGIVKQHEGHIDVQTQVGQGTTFRLYWPALAIARPQVGVEAPSEVMQGQGETILVVEDDTTMRVVLADVLDMLGYRVLEAANGREALTICEQHADEIALVLSDWVMPVMGGLELVRELEGRHLTPKVLMVTGHPLAKEVKEAVPANVVGWVLKPPSLEQLAEAVFRALARSHE